MRRDHDNPPPTEHRDNFGKAGGADRIGHARAGDSPEMPLVERYNWR